MWGVGACCHLSESLPNCHSPGFRAAPIQPCWVDTLPSSGSIWQRRSQRSRLLWGAGAPGPGKAQGAQGCCQHLLPRRQWVPRSIADTAQLQQPYAWPARDTAVFAQALGNTRPQLEVLGSPQWRVERKLGFSGTQWMWKTRKQFAIHRRGKLSPRLAQQRQNVKQNKLWMWTFPPAGSAFLPRLKRVWEKKKKNSLSFCRFTGRDSPVSATV